MFHIVFYVPHDHAEKVKEKMFQAGAGRIGKYEKCSFESKGVGQFRPLKGSDPFIGQQDKLERVEELKVEMVCEELVIESVIKAIKDTHPYETPAYHVIKILNY